MKHFARIGATAIGLLCAAATCAAPPRARAADANPDPFMLKDPSTVMVGVGGWEVARDNLRKPEFDLVVRAAEHFWVIKPQLGVIVAGDGDVLAFAGPVVDYRISQHMVATASTSVGTWAGGGFNLGSRIEFHSGLDVAWRFDDASRLGIGFYHTSNADISQRNPGSESLLLEYSLPLIEIFK